MVTVCGCNVIDLRWLLIKRKAAGGPNERELDAKLLINTSLILSIEILYPPKPLRKSQNPSAGGNEYIRNACKRVLHVLLLFLLNSWTV